MKQQYTPLATLICKWLKLHWLECLGNYRSGLKGVQQGSQEK